MQIKRFPVWARLGVGFAVLLVLLFLAGGAGIWGADKLSRQITRSLATDGRISAGIAEVAVHSLGLRRYEKDIFLNIELVFYLTKYLFQYIFGGY